MDRFVSHRHKFRIWEPGRFRAELTEATDKVRAFKTALGSRTAAAKPLGARG
jgi:MraZ protein